MSAFHFEERYAHSIAQCLSSVTPLSLQRASTDPLCQRVLVNALQAAGAHADVEWVELNSVVQLARILAGTAAEYCT